jgi:lysophospholipase L1-like esterase
VCLLSTFAPAQEPAQLSEHLRFYGRWDRRQADRAVTVNSGSHVVARFEGTGITARFDLSRNKDPIPTIAWRIDDAGEWREAEIAAAVELAKGLKPGPHTVTLFARGMDEHQPRWAEPLTASLTFLGFELAGGGKLLDPPAEPKLKLEFLGDSITEGVLVHPQETGKPWPWLTDGPRAYSAVTAMKLGAQWRQVGFGAMGVTRGGSGGTPSAPDAFDWFYAGCPRDDWQPDLVVVNQGTNDGGVAAEKFRPEYARYLALIRKGYPDAQIAALRPFNGAHAEDIAAEVAKRNEAGDAKVFYVDTTGWLGPDDFTDGVHPDADAGPKVAERLAKVISDRVRPAE